jgi:hypothetical protein
MFLGSLGEIMYGHPEFFSWTTPIQRFGGEEGKEDELKEHFQGQPCLRT